jgi:hypothetical protein
MHKMSYVCSVVGKPTYAMKPKIFSPEHPVVRKGKDLDLQCQGFAQKGVEFQVTWLKLNKSVCILFVCFSIHFSVCL